MLNGSHMQVNKWALFSRSTLKRSRDIRRKIENDWDQIWSFLIAKKCYVYRPLASVILKLLQIQFHSRLDICLNYYTGYFIFKETALLRCDDFLNSRYFHVVC